jgi:hypothetical protein
MRLKNRPITAVTAISNPLTSCGSITLSAASKTSQIVRVNKKMILNKVPRISALCHPNVSSLDADLIANLSAAIDMANPTISEVRCAVSVKIAMELARYPPTNYAAMKNIDTNDTHFNFDIEAL